MKRLFLLSFLLACSLGVFAQSKFVYQIVEKIPPVGYNISEEVFVMYYNDRQEITRMQFSRMSDKKAKVDFFTIMMT